MISPAPVLQTERLLYVVDLLLTQGHPVLLAGEAATGKSAFVEVLVEPHHPYTYSRIHPAFSTVHLRHLLSRGVQSQAQANTRPGQHLDSKDSFLFLLEDLHLAASGEELVQDLELQPGSLFTEPPHISAAARARQAPVQAAAGRVSAAGEPHWEPDQAVRCPAGSA